MKFTEWSYHMSEIKLDAQQQAIEDGQLAREVLENRIFQEKITGNIDYFTKAMLDLEPHESDAFPIVQAARKYLTVFLKSIEAVAQAGQDAESGIKKEGGLI